MPVLLDGATQLSVSSTRSVPVLTAPRLADKRIVALPSRVIWLQTSLALPSLPALGDRPGHAVARCVAASGFDLPSLRLPGVSLEQSDTTNAPDHSTSAGALLPEASLRPDGPRHETRRPFNRARALPRRPLGRVSLLNGMEVGQADRHAGDLFPQCQSGSTPMLVCLCQTRCIAHHVSKLQSSLHVTCKRLDGNSLSAPSIIGA